MTQQRTWWLFVRFVIKKLIDTQCNSRPVRTQTVDLYRVKGQLSNTLNDLDADQGWLNDQNYV